MFLLLLEVFVVVVVLVDIDTLAKKFYCLSWPL